MRGEESSTSACCCLFPIPYKACCTVAVHACAFRNFQHVRDSMAFERVEATTEVQQARALCMAVRDSVPALHTKIVVAPRGQAKPTTKVRSQAPLPLWLVGLGLGSGSGSASSAHPHPPATLSMVRVRVRVRVRVKHGSLSSPSSLPPQHLYNTSHPQHPQLCGACVSDTSMRLLPTHALSTPQVKQPWSSCTLVFIGVAAVCTILFPAHGPCAAGIGYRATSCITVGQANSGPVFQRGAL